MSNPLAIATVTAALEMKLQDAANMAVGSANIQIGRPDDNIGQGNKPTVSLYLYQVMPNKALRNNCQPVRNQTGSLTENPAVALDLYYLMSFYGDTEKFEPERMAARVVQMLESKPILSRAFIEKVIAENDPILKSSNLHKSAETVKATLLEMDLESMSKLWSIFFQVPYALSLPYICSYVLVEGDEMGGPALPVTTRSVTPMPLSKVSISSIEAESGSSDPIVWDKKIRVKGLGLAKTDLRLQIDGIDADLTKADIQSKEILLPLTTVVLSDPVFLAGLSPADLAAELSKTRLSAGLKNIQLLDPPPTGAPAHLYRRSDLVSFPLRSKLKSISYDNGVKKIKVIFSPAITKGQSVRLLLDELVTDSPKNFVLSSDAVLDADYPVDELMFPVGETIGSTYLVHAQVDGVVSTPEIESDPTDPNYGQITGPKVTVT